MGTTVVISNSGTTQIIGRDEILHIDTQECRDFDYAYGLIEEILADPNLDGPDQMRLVLHIADAFLSEYDESHDFDHYVIVDPS